MKLLGLFSIGRRPSIAGALSLAVIATIAAGVFSNSQALSAGGEDTFYPAADASVFQFVPNGNYGADETLAVGSRDQYGFAENFLIKFDLDALSGAKVNWVNLRLYSHEVRGNSPYPEIYKVTQSWQESNVTWNSKPTEDSSADVGDDWVRGTGWFETYSEDIGTYELARIVQEWLDSPSTNHGLLFRVDDAFDESAYFYSREHSNASFRSHLIVN